MKQKVPFAKMVLFGALPNFLKVWLYRLKGAKLGSNVKFGLCSYVSADQLEMADDAKIGPFSFVLARRLKMGKRSAIKAFVAVDTVDVEIGDDSIIMEEVVVGGMVSPRSKLVLGKRVKVFPWSMLNPTEPIIVEDEASVGGENAIFTHASWKSKLDGFPVAFGPVHIKKRAWLPWRLLIMPNVTIGEDAVVGGGSVVTRSIPPRCLAIGSPAKVVKEGDEFIRQYTETEKHEIVLEIMQDFRENLEFAGIPVTSKSLDDGVTLVIEQDGRSNNVSYHRSSVAVAESRADVVVTLVRLDPEARDHIVRSGRMWFDLKSKECSYARDPMWEEVRTFFGRYGIRFDVQD